MRELKPYRTTAGLRKAVDNGGRFYNFFSQADDQVITRGELAKAAGVFTAGLQAFLFLDMASQDLEQRERDAVISMLDSKLKRDRQRLAPLILKPSQLDEQGVAGRAAVVTGYPRFVENRSEFSAFIYMPVSAGAVTTFIPVPIFDQFDVYEVFDDRRMRKPNSMVATSRGQRLEHDGPMRFGGVLKKLEFKDETKQEPHELYIETLYYTKLES